MDNPDMDTGKNRSYYGRIFFVLLLFNLCFALWCLFFYFPGNYQDSLWPLIGKVFVLLFVEIIFIPIGMYLFLKMLNNREETDPTSITRDQSQDMLSQSTGMYSKTPIRSMLRESWEYAWKGYVSQWAVLAVFTVIYPLGLGYLMLVMRGINPAPKPEGYYSLFIDGIKLILIIITYVILLFFSANILSIPVFFLFVLALIPTVDPTSPLFLVVKVSLIVIMIFLFILSSAGIIGIGRFARTGVMGESLEAGEIWGIVKNIGWQKMVGSYIILCGTILFPLVLLYLIETGVYMVTSNRMINLGVFFTVVVTLYPIISIMAARYASLLYDEGVEPESNTTEPDLPIKEHLVTKGE